MHHLTVQEPCSTLADPQPSSWMAAGGIQHSGSSHYLLMFCLVFCLLLFNGSNPFFAAPESYLARNVLCVIDSEKSFITELWHSPSPFSPAVSLTATFPN